MLLHNTGAGVHAAGRVVLYIRLFRLVPLSVVNTVVNGRRCFCAFLGLNGATRERERKKEKIEHMCMQKQQSSPPCKNTKTNLKMHVHLMIGISERRYKIWQPTWQPAAK